MDGLAALLTIGTGIGSSLLLGFFKKHTTVLDTKVGNWIKPAQPAIVAGLSIALPYLANKIGMTSIPDAQILVNAPISGLIGVIAREYAYKLGNK